MRFNRNNSVTPKEASLYFYENDPPNSRRHSVSKILNNSSSSPFNLRKMITTSWNEVEYTAADGQVYKKYVASNIDELYAEGERIAQRTLLIHKMMLLKL